MVSSGEAAQDIAACAAISLAVQGERLLPLPHTKLLYRQLGRVMSGEIDRLLIILPPRHGKTLAMQATVATWLYHDPRASFILTAYGQELADEMSLGIKSAFANLGGEFGWVSRVSFWTTDSGGVVRAPGAGGTIVGRGARTALIVDDLVKGREAADSHAVRTKLRKWYRGDFRTRLEPGGAIVCIGTRWRSDDPIGMLIEDDAQGGKYREGWTILFVDMEHDPGSLSELREKLPDNEIIGLDREEGELLPLYPEPELRKIKRSIGQREWSAQFQGRPVPDSGLMFNRRHFEIVDAAPAMTHVVRAWDLGASSSPTADQTAGILMGQVGKGVDRQWYILDAQVGRWEPGDRIKIIRTTASQDGRRINQVFEQEPGSSGKSDVLHLIAAVAPSRAESASTSTGDKRVRARGLAAQCAARNVKLLRGPWNKEFLDEIGLFPAGAHDDQVDGAAHAFNWLAEQPGHLSLQEMMDAM